MTTFTFGTQTASITIGPLLPQTLLVNRSQVSGLDSSGIRYVYGRPAAKRAVSLTFPAVTAAELSALEAFVSTVISGTRHPFVWSDGSHSHAVRYVSHSVQRRSLDWYRVSLTLEETL